MLTAPDAPPDRGCAVRKLSKTSLPALIAVAGVALPLLASCGAASSASMPSASIGKQLAELKGSDTVANDCVRLLDGHLRHDRRSRCTASRRQRGRACVRVHRARDRLETVAELKGSDTAAGSQFGISVAISGTTIVVGAPTGVKEAGRAYVFTRQGAGWRQAFELKASDTGQGFGASVSISGTTAIVGNGGGLNGGRAYVFAKAASGWKQAAELKASDTNAPGNSVSSFGIAVGISGTTAIVGSNLSFAGNGRAYIFSKQTAGWKQVTELKDPHPVQLTTSATPLPCRVRPHSWGRTTLNALLCTPSTERAGSSSPC